MTSSSSAENPPEVSSIERRLRALLEHVVVPITVILSYFGERAIMLGNALAIMPSPCVTSFGCRGASRR